MIFLKIYIKKNAGYCDTHLSKLLISLILSVSMSSNIAQAAPPLYRVTDLGDLPGGNSDSIAYGINNLGHVVGMGVTGGASSTAFLWKNGSIVSLDDLPGGVIRSEAFAINDTDQIVGRGYSDISSFRAVVWDNGTITDLGDLPGGSPEAKAFDINNPGQIVGESNGTLSTWATSWENGNITELKPPIPVITTGPGSAANGINNLGQIVGHASIGPGGRNQAVLWDANGNATNLGTLFPQINDRSTANDINNLGQIVGSSGNGISSDIAVLWDNGTIIELGNIPEGNNDNAAFAINDVGQIVGTGSIIASTRPFLWQEGELFDLLDSNDPQSADTLLLEAFDINNTGQIVGRALFQKGNNGSPAFHAFLLTPITIAPVPVEKCTLDADGNESVDALTDGLIFIRHMFGIRGVSLVEGATASNCSFCVAAEIEPILDQCAATGTSDIDGNGNVDALTDGLLIIRFILGIRGGALITDSIGDDCARCTVLEIEDYLQELIH